MFTAPLPARVTYRRLITQWHEGVIAQISRVEVRFQQPEPEPPPMQYQHIDPGTGENEYNFASLPAAAEVGLLTAEPPAPRP